jgi:phage terminase Nu1 subunit (DNA packaging protein)
VKPETADTAVSQKPKKRKPAAAQVRDRSIWPSAEALRTDRADMLAMPSRCAARLPHLTPHDIGEIDAEVRAALVELGNDG